MDSSRELSVPAIAQRLGCTIPHAQMLIRTGRIPGRKTAYGWVTTEAAWQTYMAKHSGETTAKVDRDQAQSD